MSRFANPQATETLSLGPCQCPGTPHEQDEVVVRSRPGYSEILSVNDGVGVGDRTVTLLTVFVKSWNLLDDNGKPVAVSPDSLAGLDPETGEQLVTAIGEMRERQVPNSSAGALPASSPEKSSRTPK